MIGLGPTTPAVATGTPSPTPPATTTAKVTATIAGVAAAVPFAGLVIGQIGAYQVNVTVPNLGPSGNLPIVLTVGGVSSQAGVTVPITGTAPNLTSVVNAASGIMAGLPNSGIAQGAIFLIVGSNLGPAAIAVDANAFQHTSVGGTSVSVTVNGQTVNALMYYSSAGQVAALMPSNTPAGAGTATVTYNSQASASFPVNVVQSNAGIFTVTSNGQGSAIVTNADYSLVSPTRAANCGGPNTTCGAANPGDTLILWATGLGPVSAPDQSGPQPGNMANLPLKLFLGGVPAAVSYQGRSGCCIGEDQIVFTVPNNVPAGCAVPLAVQIGDQISNYTGLPVAASGRSCPMTAAYLSGSVMDKLASGSPVTYGHIKLNRRLTNSGAYQDRGDAQFAKVSLPAALTPFAHGILDDLPVGTCSVANSFNSSAAPSNSLGAPDAGPSLTVNGPGGAKTLVKQSGGPPTDYFAVLGPGNYLNNGTFTITGTGGPDLGALSASIDLAAMPVWTNQASLSAVNRANDLTITWTGGTPNTVVRLTGESATDSSFSFGALFQCSWPATAGSLTVPSSVLQSLPAGPYGALSFSVDASTTTFNASGLDLGYVTSNRETVIAVAFQ